MKHPHDGFDTFDSDFFASWDGQDRTGHAMDWSGPAMIVAPVTGALFAQPGLVQPTSFGGDVSHLEAGLAATIQPGAVASGAFGS